MVDAPELESGGNVQVQVLLSVFSGLTLIAAVMQSKSNLQLGAYIWSIQAIRHGTVSKGQVSYWYIKKSNAEITS